MAGYEAHGLARQVSNQISTTTIDSDHWMAKVKTLRDLIVSHVKEEEDKVFPKAKDVIDDDQQKAIARQIQELKTSRTSMP